MRNDIKTILNRMTEDFQASAKMPFEYVKRADYNILLILLARKAA